MNDLLFCFRIAFFVLRTRPEIVMCSTQPPVIGAAAAGWAARLVGAKFVYHLQDIHPEVVCETGHVRSSIVMRLLKWIDKRTVAKADRVVLLSQDMLEFMQGRVPASNDKLSIIPNFNLPRFDELQDPPAEWVKKPGVFRLMFAGNVGRFQNLEAIVDACLKVSRDRAFEFVLMGDGKAKAGLRRRASEAGDERIRFLDRQPLSIAEPLMADADICVVSLEPEVYRYAFPSKLASHLSLGTPVLVVCEQNSQLSRLPIEHGFGLASPQSPEQAILEQINFAIDHPDAIAKMRDHASEFFANQYSLQRVLPLWTELFDCVLSNENA